MGQACGDGEGDSRDTVCSINTIQAETGVGRGLIFLCVIMVVVVG